MAKTPILLLLTWTLLQASADCDKADTCVAVRPCDNAKNIASQGSSTNKKLSELQAVTAKLQAAVDALTKKNTGELYSCQSERIHSALSVS